MVKRVAPRDAAAVGDLLRQIRVFPDSRQPGDWQNQRHWIQALTVCFLYKMQHDHQVSFSHTRELNSQAGHSTSRATSAGMLRHVGRRGANMGARHDMNHSLQRTTVGAHDPLTMSGRDLSGVVDHLYPDQYDLACSMQYRMAGMRMAFADSGGLRTVGELAPGNDPHSQARFAHIARGIATREIIGFMWQSEPWVPMFQFHAGAQMQRRQALQPLFDLLIPLYDAWEMANWFARPNQCLSGRKPVDECAHHLSAVLDVAHLEHFIATGQSAQRHRAATCI